MKNDKRDKMVSIRINSQLLVSIQKLNKLQRDMGNNYSVSDTINYLLIRCNNDIKMLENSNNLFKDVGCWGTTNP